MAAPRQSTRPPDSPDARLPQASLQLRIVGASLDLVVLGTVFLLFVAVAGLQILLRTDWGAETDVPNNVYWIAIAIIVSFFVLVPLYFFAFWAWRGQSVGMMAVRIAVRDRNGIPPNVGRAALRTLFWPISIFPLALGVLTIFFDEDSRLLHDILSGTTVVELP